MGGTRHLTGIYILDQFIGQFKGMARELTVQCSEEKEFRRRKLRRECRMRDRCESIFFQFLASSHRSVLERVDHMENQPPIGVTGWARRDDM
jgi:hypothetical protein